MYVIYITKYKTENGISNNRLCIYDRRSPSEDLAALNPSCDLVDSKAGSLSITLPPTHLAYDLIEKNKTLISMYRLERSGDPDNKYLSERLVFEGPVRRCEKDFYKNRRLYAEGFFSFLNETVQPQKEYFNVTLTELLSNLISIHNSRMEENGDNHKTFVLGTVEIEFPDKNSKSEFEATQYDTTMACFLGIQERFGGHFIFSKIDGPRPYRIDYIKDLPKKDSQPIRFGENLLDYLEESDGSDICSCVIPISTNTSVSLSEVGDIIMSSDISKIPSEYHVVSGTDVENPLWEGVETACWVVYRDWGSSSQSIAGYIYYDRILVQKSGDDTPGAYDLSGIMPSEYDYRVLRYFTTSIDERLYISSRMNVGATNAFWCYYGYNRTQDVLAYESLDDVNQGWASMVDKELDLSYTSEGQDLYIDRSNNSKGELLVSGWGSDIQTSIKRAKYFYSSNPKVGEEILPTTIHWHQALWRNTEEDEYSYTIYGTQTPYHSVLEFDIPSPGNRDYDAILITTRAKLDPVGAPYVGDALWCLKEIVNDNPHTEWQLNYERIDSNKEFTSVINRIIDLTEADNIGAQKLYLSCWGLRAPDEENPGSAPIIPVVRKCKKYADKLTNYVTVEGADADEYHDRNSIYVKDRRLIDKYGYSEKRLEFNNIEDPNVLVKRSEAYLTDTQFGNLTINVSGIDLHDMDIDVESIDISTQNKIEALPYNINRYFEVSGITINPDNIGSSKITFTETNEGVYNGPLPTSVVVLTPYLENTKLYGTPEGLITPNQGNLYDIHVYITNLVTNRTTEIIVNRTEPLVYPEYVLLGDDGEVGGFDSGLVEISTTAIDSGSGEYPTIEFKYKKMRD